MSFYDVCPILISLWECMMSVRRLAYAAAASAGLHWRNQMDYPNQWGTNTHIKTKELDPTKSLLKRWVKTVLMRYVLPVRASGESQVLPECIFSSSQKTPSSRRNRLSSSLPKVLMAFKYSEVRLTRFHGWIWCHWRGITPAAINTVPLSPAHATYL